MKFDTGVQQAIYRLKQPGNQRVTANLREAAEKVATYLAEISPIGELLPGGYRAQLLQFEGGRCAFLTKGEGVQRIAIVAYSKPLWDAEGAVLVASSEDIRNFTNEASQGLLEAMIAHISTVYEGRLKVLEDAWAPFLKPAMSFS